MAINVKQGDNKINHYFFFFLMAHNVIKSDCHYLQIHFAGPQGLFNEKCRLNVH